MTNYKLEDFKLWLEAKPERKSMIDLERIEDSLSGSDDLTVLFDKLMKKERFLVFHFCLGAYDSWRTLAQEFMEERERERESKWGGEYAF